MRGLDKEIEVHWFDSDHGTTSVEQFIEFQARMIDFAQRIIETGPVNRLNNHHRPEINLVIAAQW